MNQTVVILSTVSLQKYIFRSNKLRENVGASWLVKYVMEDGLLTRMAGLDTTGWNKASGLESDGQKSSSKGEVLYLAGGNAVFLFKDKPAAKEAVFNWSRWLLDKAPGLRAVAGMAETGENLQEAFAEAIKDLERNSNSAPLHTMLPAQPMIRTCPGTGDPATTVDKLGNIYSYISSETAAKRNSVQDALESADKDFADILSAAGKKIYNFPKEFEELGGSEGESRIAVVHIDGNGMGTLLQQILEHEFFHDQDFKDAIRAFAASLKQAALESFTETLETLGNALTGLVAEKKLYLKKGLFPLRPLVYGGDDITFVCDARIGLSVAARYLKKFSDKNLLIPDNKQFQPTACAGVAIVPAKYPFTRAYRLAEALCANAKQERIRERPGLYEGAGGSWLDFQVVYGGSDSGLGPLREKQFRAATGKSLLYRPWPVEGNQNIQLRWQHLLEGVRWFQDNWPRSHAKNFKEALTRGKEATKQAVIFNESRGRSLPLLNNGTQAQNSGWAGEKTPYFDCLELMETCQDF